MVAEDLISRSRIQRELDDLQERAEGLLERKQGVAELIQQGVEPGYAKHLLKRNFDRKAEFSKLAFWLREFGDDDDMAQFIEKIALEKNFARDFRAEKHLLRMMVKMFKTAENYFKPHDPGEGPSGYVSRFMALKKETTLIRTFINRLTHTIYRGTQRKLHGGTRDESRGSPDCCKDQAQAQA